MKKQWIFKEIQQLITASRRNSTIQFTFKLTYELKIRLRSIHITYIRSIALHFFYYLLKVDLQPFLKMKKHLKINCSPKAVSLLSKNEISDIGAKEKRTK